MTRFFVFLSALLVSASAFADPSYEFIRRTASLCKKQNISMQNCFEGFRAETAEGKFSVEAVTKCGDVLKAPIGECMDILVEATRCEAHGRNATQCFGGDKFASQVLQDIVDGVTRCQANGVSINKCF